jgi:predicted enzyme related to lactoylglutathione lyase
MRLRGAMIYMKDLPRMQAFYRQMLRVAPADETDGWVRFDAGGVSFALHAIPAHIASRIHIPSPPPPRETNPVKLIFEVDDVESTRARLEALGIATVQRPWGSWDGVDPEGNIFQFWAPERAEKST